MMDLFWSLPVLFAISVVLGTCRAQELGPILKESSKTFVRILAAIVICTLVLQLVLWIVPRIT